MSVMTAPKKSKKPVRSGSQLGIAIDPALRDAVDAWIKEYNAAHDHRATLTSTVEAALRKYIATRPGKPPDAE